MLQEDKIAQFETLNTLVLKSISLNTSGIIEAYIRRYILPSLIQDEETVLLFIQEYYYLFLQCAVMQLFERFDFSDVVFFLKEKEENHALGVLAGLGASSFKLSDEAAWVLIEESPSKKWTHLTNGSMNTIWFRCFENEKIYANPVLCARFKNALQRAIDLQPKENSLFPSSIAGQKDGILNFQFGEPWSAGSKDRFALTISQNLEAEKPAMGKDIINWVLDFVSSEHYRARISPVIDPLVLHSEVISLHLKEKHKIKASKRIDKINNHALKITSGDFWHNRMTVKEVKQAIKEHPSVISQLEIPWIRHDGVFNMSGEHFIDAIIKNDLYDFFSEHHKKSFAYFVKRFLFRKFNVKVESCSLEQLLSIYTISKEEAHV